MTDTKHLWEYDHPYYCNEGNYYSNECHHTFCSWEDFYVGWGDSDMDMNLVFRWDWTIDEETGEHSLFVGFMGQRKGRYQSCRVTVVPEDEDTVRAWLTVRAKHMVAVWAPLLGEVPS